MQTICLETGVCGSKIGHLMIDFFKNLDCDSALVNLVRGHLQGTREQAAAVRWREVSELLLGQSAGFALHEAAFNEVYRDEPMPHVMWSPSRVEQTESNIARIMDDGGHLDPQALYSWSVAEPQQFWSAMVKRIGVVFQTRPQTTLNQADLEHPVWFPGGQLNIVESCFAADAEETALVLSTSDGGLKAQTFGQLKVEVCRVASALRVNGFEPGDRIALFMPMTAECIAIYLGIIAAGCVAVSIADSFASPEIQQRLEIADAKAIFAAATFNRAGREIDLFSRVREAQAPRAIVIGECEVRAGDLSWEAFRGSGSDAFDFHVTTPDAHVNVLFSSGTTGEPKAIPWSQTVPIKCAIDGHLHHDIREGDVVAWPTNIGWMMGPWLIFASLINKATIALYHDAPVGGGFGKFVQDARVTMLGVVPTLVRAWRETQSMEAFDWTSVRCFSSTGEASTAADMLYLSWLAKYRPVIEYCGGTEVGGAYLSSTVLQPNAPGCFSTPALGSGFVLLDEEGAAADSGELFLTPPAMGLSVELLNRDHHETYYAGTPKVEGKTLRRHGDYIQRLHHGFYRASGRTDDTMNLGGIKVGSAEIERVLLEGLDEVSEAAAIGVSDAGGGPQQLVVFAVLLGSVEREQLIHRMNKAIRADLNPLFRIADLMIVDSLPRTASNKVMRRTLRDQLVAPPAAV